MPAPTSSGTFTVALPDMGNFELVLVVGTTRSYLDSLYDYVVGADNDGLLDTSSGWAESWEVNSAGDQWTITGRDGVAFHNGDNASSADIKFQFDRYLAEDSPLAAAANVQESVASMDTPDDSTIVFNLMGRDLFFPTVMLSRLGNAGGPSHLIPSGYIESVGIDEAIKAPVGSGPFKFDSVSVGEKLELEAVEDHWLYGVPRVQSLVYVVIPEESTRLGLVRTGDADLALLSRNSIQQILDDNLQLFGREGSGVASYRFDEQWVEEYEGYGPNPLANAEIRKALDWYAIDRQTLVDAYVGGVGTPTMNFPTSPRDPSFEALPIPEYDPDRAKQILEEQGYPDGFEMDLWIGPRPALPEGPEIAEQMAVWWEQIGIKVNRLPGEYAAYRGALLDGEGFTRPTAYGVWFLGYETPASAHFTTLHFEGFAFGTSWDPELNELSGAWKGAATESEYIERGRAYMQASYDKGNTTTLFSTGEVFAGSGTVPEGWNLGSAAFSYQIEQAAIIR